MTPELVAIFITVPFALLACWALWRHWRAPWPAKVLISAGILCLLMPGACMGIVATRNSHEDTFMTALMVSCLIAFFALAAVVGLALRTLRAEDDPPEPGS